MICKQILHILNGIISFLFQCRIYIGRRPIDAEAPALIFSRSRRAGLTAALPV